MPDENDLNTQKSPSTFLDVITGKVGKITALLLALVALLTAVEKLFDTGSTLLEGEQKSVTRDCFKPELIYPKTASVKDWNENTIDLLLQGRNDCEEPMGIHVAFKATAGPINIEPNNPQCTAAELANPACWDEKYPLKHGDVVWHISPPRLARLSAPSREPSNIEINWVVFDLDTKTRLRSDKAKIELVPEPSGTHETAHGQ